MSKDLGTINPGKTIYIEFDSFGSSGESLTLSGLAAADVEVYKDGGTTQRASDAGYTLLDTDGIDFDGVTGIHGLSIDLADNTTAGFWAAGSHYRVVISSVTINAQTVSFTAATFRIGYGAAILDTTIATLASQTSFTLTSGPADDDALNGMWAVIHDVASAVQKAVVQILDYTGATKTVTLAAGATFTAAATDNISIMGPMPLQPATTGRTLGVESDGDLTKVNTLDGHTAQTGDSYAIVNSGTHGNAALKTLIDAVDNFVDTEVAAIVSAIGTPSNLGGGATLAFNLSDIEAQTDDIGAAGAGLTAVVWNASWDAEVQSEVDDALKAALAEGYRSAGATGSVRDMLYEIIAHLGESAISSTTKTLKKIDGSTTAKTYTLDSATTPTSITETT